jgi:pre-mRNA-processing factor SLU7
MRNAYCTGEAGKEAAEASAKMMQAKLEQGKVGMNNNSSVANGKDLAAAIIKSGKAASSEVSTKRRLGEGDVDLDKEKLQQAIEAERKKKKKADDNVDEDEEEDRFGGKKKKSKYNSASDHGKSFEVTEEELEAYRMEKSRGDDPMANYKDEDDQE